MFRLLNSSKFHGVYRLFVLLFKNKDYRKTHRGYFRPKVETKGYSFMIDQPTKSDQITYDSIRKIATGQGDNYTTGC